MKGRGEVGVGREKEEWDAREESDLQQPLKEQDQPC